MAAQKSYHLSVLDASPVVAGSSGRDALRNSLDLAQLVDALGYNRYWLTEHHNTPLIAGSAPEIMIGHIAAATKTLRVGSGGIMLPNHTPLKVAETFRVLEALHPGRVDLGLGRAPGTDPVTAMVLRNSRDAVTTDDFPSRLDDLLSFLHTEGFADEHPLKQIRAMPDDVPMPAIWILGSSESSAMLAAQLGLRFAFAHQIQQNPAVPALRAYRKNFKPSKFLSEPEALLSVSIICADTDEHATELARPMSLALLQLATRRAGKFPTVQDAIDYPYSPDERAFIDANHAQSQTFIGSPETVHRRVTQLADETGVDEIMISTLTHDHEDRRRSYELLADAFEVSGQISKRELASSKLR